MKRIIATTLLLAMLTNSAAAAGNCKYGHPCGPTPAAKQSVRTAQRSKLVRQTPRRDTATTYQDRTIRYQPESAATKQGGCSACWLVGAALVGGGIAYLIAQSNDDAHVTNVTVVTPPEKKKPPRGHDDDD